MNSLARKSDEEMYAIKIFFTNDSIGIILSDGREVHTPLDFYPRLKNATASQRNNFELIGLGTGIHWPEIDEDLSVEGIVMGRKAIF